ncbi:hypothetical protein [Piscirickettsia salmonis]|uniref:hypothetical protein n=1 Tax=Piscirickettsia salmonis TaxID=1238 RepID=UPI0007C8A453|nr:hypothetical protein A0O36_02821 [Piscirickettsiaceae bacterium NZ-RLO1]
MPKKTFAFDLDETLLTAVEREEHLNLVPRTLSGYDPYNGYYSGTYTLQKEKMAAMMQNILLNGHEVICITSGDISKEEAKKFFLVEYNVGLGNSFLHFNKIKNKTPILKKIAGQRNYSDIVFIDRKRRYLGRYFAHPMMQNRRAKRDDYKPSAALVTGHYVP